MSLGEAANGMIAAIRRYGEANEREARQLAITRLRLRADQCAAGLLRMAVDQPRNPHTGEWVGDGVPDKGLDMRSLLDSLPGGPDIYYHGSRSRLGSIDQELFITPDRDAAFGYLEGGAGHVYALRLDPSSRIADEGDMVSAANQLWGSAEKHFGYEPYVYELADNADVRAQLAKDGFAGASFIDLGPDNAYEHPTIVLWDGSDLTTEGSVDVPAHDRDVLS